MTTPPIPKVASDLDEAVRVARRLKPHYAEAYDLGHSGGKGEQEGRPAGSHSDPTGAVVVGRDQVRSEVRSAARAVKEAVDQLKAAEASLHRAHRRSAPVSFERREHEKKPACRNCDARPTFANALCKACHEYERRTGNVRPWDVIEKDRSRQAKKGIAS